MDKRIQEQGTSKQKNRQLPIKTLRLSGKHVRHSYWKFQILPTHYIYVFQLILTLITDNLTNPSINILVLLTVTASVLFEMKAELLNAILLRHSSKC